MSAKRNFLLPEWNEGKQQWEWSQFEVKRCNNKSCFGLFARVELAPNTQFEYLGRLIKERTYQTLLKKRKRGNKQAEHRLRYTCDLPEAKGLIDASPSDRENGGAVGGNGKFIAGKINEPGPDEKANAVLTAIAHPQGKKVAGVIITERVLPGHEILVHYGADYERDYPVGAASDFFPTSFKRQRRC